MAKVTFECKCPQSVVQVAIDNPDTGKEVDTFTFQKSGTKTRDLPVRELALAYRATGTPETDFSLEVTKGGTMNTVERTIKADGRAAGNRKLTVEKP